MLPTKLSYEGQYKVKNLGTVRHRWQTIRVYSLNKKKQFRLSMGKRTFEQPGMYESKYEAFLKYTILAEKDLLVFQVYLLFPIPLYQ